ncbi:hypothetical protein ACNOYE_29050 [Nannocystaceae bacterium ST9]
MDTVDLRDPSRRLYRLHHVRSDLLDEKLRESSWDPITVVWFKKANGARVLLVTDGTHRTQAAIDRGDSEIACKVADLQDVIRVARNRHVNLEALAESSKPFRRGEYD